MNSVLVCFFAAALVGCSARGQSPGKVAKSSVPPTSKTAATATKTTGLDTKSAGPATKAVARGGLGSEAAKPPKPPVSTAADTMTSAPTVMREVFTYERPRPQDPFFSLLSTNDLRPTLDELTLMGIIYSPEGGSVATLHDATNKQYRVKVDPSRCRVLAETDVHSRLGRMCVTAIRPNAVIFTIEELGQPRQDSLVLNDSTRTRRP